MERTLEADRLYRGALEAQRRILGNSHQDTLDTLYNLAALRAGQGRLSEALDMLREAVANGWSDAEWPLEDPDLSPLHGNAEFEAILSKID